MTDKTGLDGDTVKLLRECDLGVKMGISAINDVLEDVNNQSFRSLLNECRSSHEKIQEELVLMLGRHGDRGKDPNPMAKGMSHIMTNMKMAFDGSDNMAADLITEGCNMGVKSLSKYLNQYSSADEKSRETAKRLISLEERLAKDIRQFL